MYHLVRTSNGEYLGQSALMSNFPKPLPPDTEIIELPDGDEKGIWNPATKSFDPRPNPEAKRFTVSELQSMAAASGTNSNASIALLISQSVGNVELDAEFKSVLSTLESDGIIAPGRAAKLFSDV